MLSHRWCSFAAAGLLATVLPRTAVSQPPAPPETTTLAGSIDLARLIDLAASRLGVRVEYTPAQVVGTVTFRGAITDAELWSVLNARLADAGVTTVAADTPGRYRVVKLDPALAAAAPITEVRWIDDAGNAAPPQALQDPMRTDLRPSLSWVGDYPPGFASALVPLRFIASKDAAEAVRPLLSRPAGTVTSLGEQALIIADLWPRLDQALRLLARADTPPAPRVLREIEVNNLAPDVLIAAARPLAPTGGGAGPGGNPATAVELIPSPGGRSVLLLAPPGVADLWEQLLRRLDTLPSADTREYVPAAADPAQVAKLIEQLIDPSADPRFRIVADDLTGTLIVTGTNEHHERVERVIKRLDQTPPESLARLRVFPIRHRPVGEVARAVTELLSAGELDDERAPDQDATAESANPADPGGSTPRADASADRRRTPRRSETPRAEERERAPAGRFPLDAGARDSGPTITTDESLNTLIVAASPRVLARVESLVRTLDVRQPQVMIEAVLVSLSEGQSAALGIELQKFTSLGGNVVQLSSLFGSTATGNPPNIAGAPGLGFTGAVLNPGDFNAVIRAIERVNAGRSTSTPRVLVTNNQDATFRSVAQQPTSAVSTNTTSTTITSFGGFQDAGTTIRVRPQIAEGDQLLLDYSVELSAFTGQPSGGLPSPRQQNSVSSVSLIPDGHTVVVGGFELLTTSEDETRVPIIGQVPLLGELFKTRTKTSDRTRFVVFIRAAVLRRPGFEDLRSLSAAARAEADVPDGTPTVEPLLIP